VTTLLKTKMYRFLKLVTSVKNWKVKEKRKHSWLSIELAASEIKSTPKNVLEEKEIVEKLNEELLHKMYDAMSEATILRKRCPYISQPKVQKPLII
jgi:hypothetical protein